MTETIQPTAECAYCRYDVPDEGDYVPAFDDEAEWARLATYHDPDCEWLATRAHRREWTASKNSDWQ